MSKEQTRELLRFMKPFPASTVEIALRLREFIWDLYPDTNELIYDNYNALAIGWSPTLKLGQVFCNLAVGRSTYNVHFGFYWGAKLSDPEKILLGKGNQYRYLIVDDLKAFPAIHIKKLMREAHSISLTKIKNPDEVRSGQTIVKSISALKRKPGKNTGNK